MENRDRRCKCFRGYTPGTCPHHSLEISKLVYGTLLVIAVIIIVSCNFVR